MPEIIFTVCLGVGLSAACGFRVFVPFLIVSLAGLNGYLHLTPSFQWIASYPALVVFSVATLFEILGYFIPWVDHALDTIAVPLATVAGVLISVSVFTDINPLLKWTLAVIAGGGAAGVVQAGTVLLRASSTAATGGLANPLVAFIELGGAVIVALAALVIPVVLVVALLFFFVFFAKKIFGKSGLFRKKESRA
ncbi:MAG: DUF4126 domain-containing protein [Elusimicrobia bacterium CG08_land_8_20_14_0_20_59_10]|nr:MAG: DUF4126 domain-containing protein [Elusimicrobia bacterium CG08_land_8_20_14_0_20_59_10]